MKDFALSKMQIIFFKVWYPPLGWDSPILKGAKYYSTEDGCFLQMAAKS